MLQLAPPVDAAQRLRGFADFPDVGETVYEIVRGADGQLVAEAREVDEVGLWKWPFARPSGPNSPQRGPIITRAIGEDFSPKLKILKATLDSFAEIAAAGAPHSPVFDTSLSVVGHDAQAVRDVLATIKSKSSVKVSLGPPPGEDQAYVDYLLAESVTTDAQGTCASCGHHDVALITDGLTSLAKINLFNRDRVGAFPGLNDDNAVRRFAVCVDCALGLRRFKIDTTPALKCRVAGQAALVLPHVSAGDPIKARQRAQEIVERIRAGTSVKGHEDRLLWTLEREQSLIDFHVLWAVVGDQLSDVEGLITDIPSTRLGRLSKLATACEAHASPVFPAERVALDLHFSFIERALYSPGGDAVKKVNATPARRALLREIAAAAYQGRQIDDRLLWAQIAVVGAAHVADARESWTRLSPHVKPAWARTMAYVLYFLRVAEVLPMPGSTYTPSSERLRPFFDVAGGLDSDAKAFAFLLGVLYGKLMSVQAARKVRVESNALTWLKGGNITGRDLPAIYAQTRQKLLEYQTSSADIRDVEGELGHLGVRIGSPLPLDGPTALYFLMLGQSLQPAILPSKSEEKPV